MKTVRRILKNIKRKTLKVLLKILAGYRLEKYFVELSK